jgi:tRNA threonylcarbamoyladenosine biosynthesis protein TsaE
MEPIVVKTLEELHKAAKKILHAIGDNRIVCFYGEMGSGKTTLIQSLCRELDVVDNVVSPTFAIVNEYTTTSGIPVYHFDFYRIKKLEEVYDFGYEEYFYSLRGYCFIEWPELVEEILPSSGVMRLSIRVLNDGNRIIEIHSLV